MNAGDSVTRWEISPFVGVGPLRFGLKRDDVRDLLGKPSTVFRKGPSADEETDAYDGLGAHLYYDKFDQLECVELFGPVPVSCRGIPLVGVPLAEVMGKFADLSIPSRYDDGYFIDDCGIVLYAPDEVVRAATAFRKGYF